MKNHDQAVKAIVELDEREGSPEELEVYMEASEIISDITGYDTSDMMSEAGALDYIFKLSKENYGNEKMMEAINLAAELLEL